MVDSTSQCSAILPLAIRKRSKFALVGPCFHSLDAIAEAFRVLGIVIGEEIADPIVMLLNGNGFPVGLYQRPVGFRLVAVLDRCRTIHLRMAGKVAIWRLRLLPAPVAAGELATAAAKDVIPSMPSARFGSCCISDLLKFRSTAVTSFFRKMSIITWRALAPNASEFVTVRSSPIVRTGSRPPEPVPAQVLCAATADLAAHCRTSHRRPPPGRAVS
jgi:hypothetical protein